MKSTTIKEVSQLPERKAKHAERPGNLAEQCANLTEQRGNTTEQCANFAERCANLIEQRINLTERQLNLTGRQLNPTERQSNMTGWQTKGAEQCIDLAKMQVNRATMMRICLQTCGIVSHGIVCRDAIDRVSTDERSD